MKTCETKNRKGKQVACGKDKPLAKFYFSKLTKDGYDNIRKKDKY